MEVGVRVALVRRIQGWSKDVCPRKVYSTVILEEAMRRFIALLVAVLALSSGWSVVEACGDKILMVGRGARFQRAYASLHPGRILVHTSRTGATAAIRDEQLHKHLTDRKSVV